MRAVIVIVTLLSLAASASAQAESRAVVELHYTPTARAQLAIWVETDTGDFLQTFGLTEAVAYRGIGNRPGASQMNSGYRWPYGRREGVLPVWAARRAAAADAKQFRRVIFQDRLSEGRASRTSADHSVDNYFCLSFNAAASRRDALDAVSCASVFTSDKGRYLTDGDVGVAYSEPYLPLGEVAGVRQALSLHSLYPPRMDVTRCTAANCYDHGDVDLFAADAREVMPEIDVATMATPQGDQPHSDLFSVPESWPDGSYVLWVEVNVEGDYNASFDSSSYPTPTTPIEDWDDWATNYGYPYRGQPSVVFAVPFELAAEMEGRFAVDAPVGASSWDHWSGDYGRMESMSGISDDPQAEPGSGADRLRVREDGTRLALLVRAVDGSEAPVEPVPEPEPGEEPSTQPEPDVPMAGGAAGSDAMEPSKVGDDPIVDEREDGTKVIHSEPRGGVDSVIGTVEELRLSNHEDRLHAHEWVRMRFRAAESTRPLHAYQVRVSREPITDEQSFVQYGRPARTATEDEEGSTALMLPVDTTPGDWIQAEVGDLTGQTRYFVGVRATDDLNRHGPITVAEITTPAREFATVTPCFVATVAYGSPLAGEVSVLRRVRDRYLMSHSPGRALGGLYYEYGSVAAQWLEQHPRARAAARALLRPLVWLAS